jgi:predicted RecA/RadA family phage recombinase
MAKVPLPERGQPIDVAYLYQITNALNQLSDQVSTATYNYTTIDTVSAGKQNIKTSEARVIGGVISVANNSTVTASSTMTFTYPFPSDFKYTPIVTASAINSGSKTSAGENVSVVLTDITRSSVSGLVKFNASGDVSTIVNIIAIGIPN